MVLNAASAHMPIASASAGDGLMESRTQTQDPFLVRTAVIASSIVTVIALLVVAAWWSGNITIASIYENYVPMTLSVAMTVLLLATAALLNLRPSKSPYVLWAPIALAAIALILSFWLLIEFIAGRHSEIDRLLGAGIGTAGGYELAQSSPLSLITMIAASAAAVLTFADRAKRWNAIVIAISMFIVSMGALVTLGYVYGSPILYGGSLRPASFLSGFCFILIGVVLVCLLGPNTWPISAFLGPSVSARLLRYFLPLMVIMVMFSGWLTYESHMTSSNPTLAAAVIAVLTAMVVGYFVSRASIYIGGQIDRTNAELVKAQEDLKQANEKLNILGSITRHDTLNRLAVVLGRMELLQEMSHDKEVQKQAKESLAAAQAIERIIQFTGEYQKLGAAGPVWVDVEDAFREALLGVDNERITIKSEVSGLEVLADSMFEKVLVNLVDNSQRHGKNVKTLVLRHRMDDKGLVLVYEDDGGGLIAEDKENLFKRGHGKHTGLGMFMSKEILSYSGMSITETGETGVGARFEISVPHDRYRLKEQ
jgi:signal transduction histidine kinase